MEALPRTSERVFNTGQGNEYVRIVRRECPDGTAKLASHNTISKHICAGCLRANRPWGKQYAKADNIAPKIDCAVKCGCLRTSFDMNQWERLFWTVVRSNVYIQL
jgi:hypothetical protein